MQVSVNTMRGTPESVVKTVGWLTLLHNDRSARLMPKKQAETPLIFAVDAFA